MWKDLRTAWQDWRQFRRDQRCRRYIDEILRERKKAAAAAVGAAPVGAAAAARAEWGSQRPRSDGASQTTDGFLTAATGTCTVPINDAVGCEISETNKNTAREATTDEPMNENRTGAPHPHNTAKQDPRQDPRWTPVPPSTTIPLFKTMPFDYDEQVVQSHKAAFLPGAKVVCRITHRAYYQLVDFKWRGGPEPAWYLYRELSEEWSGEDEDWSHDEQEWSHERGELVDKVPEHTPAATARKVAEGAEETALDEYAKRWDASLDARHALIMQALCTAIEKASRGTGLSAGTTDLPGGWIPFTVPADGSLYEPPVPLAVRWEPNTQEEPPQQEPPAACLIIVCSDEVA